MAIQPNEVGMSGKLGVLFTAWAFVTGLAATFASALYGRTGNVHTVAVWVGFPLAVFTMLVVLTGLGFAAARTARPKRRRKDGPAPGEGVRHTRRQTAYGTRR